MSKQGNEFIFLFSNNVGRPIMPRPDETAKELQKRTKDAIEGTVYDCIFWVHL
jgi:hypothetical protein